MSEKSPDLYNALVRIYQEIVADPELSNYSFPTIAEIVNEKIDRHSILNLLIDRLENSSDSNSNNDDALKLDAAISGKVYRSLEKPVDLYQEMKIIGESTQDSNSTFKLEGELIYRFSI
jgi:hypothetical protein